MSKVILLSSSQIKFIKCKNDTLSPEKLLEWWDNHRIQYPYLFNGDILAYDRLDINNSGVTTFYWYQSKYAHYRLRTDPHSNMDYARVIYCSIALGTEENEIVFGRMASNTSEPGCIQLPGGNIELDKSEKDINLEICKKNALRELKEELGLEFTECDLYLWKIKLGGDFGDVGFIFRNHQPILKERQINEFSKHKLGLIKIGETPEFSDLLFIKAGDVSNIDNQKIVDYGCEVIMQF